MALSNINTRNLIIEAQNGNIDARNKLIEISIPQIKKCIRDKVSFDDIFQDTIIRMIKYLNSFDVDKGNFNHWLSVLTKNNVRKLHKQNQRNIEKPISSFLFDDPNEIFEKFFLSDPQSFDQESENVKKMNRIIEEVEKLPRREKTAVQLCWFEGLKHEEAAEFLGISKMTNKSNLSRAKAKIIKQLNK